MLIFSNIHTIGFYCGRHGIGLLAEPQNTFTNLAFIVGAVFAHRQLQKSGVADNFLRYLLMLLGLIGIGSFIFHAYPTPITLYIDLVPIQLYTLAVLAYLLTRVLGLTAKCAFQLVLAFFLFRQAWMFLLPQGLLGGGFSHVPTLIVLVSIIWSLCRRGLGLWKYLVASAASYTAALLVRSWDVPLCDQFPFGLHWAWHLLTALAATLVLVGLIRHRPASA